MTSHAQSSQGGNSAILLSNDNLYGVQLEVKIPTNGNSQEVGFFIDAIDEPFQKVELLEIAWRESGVHWSWPTLSESGQTEYASIDAELDRSYEVTILKNDDLFYFIIDGHRIATVNATIDPKHMFIGAFSDSGDAFEVEIDNIKILEKSSSGTADTIWALSLEFDDDISNSSPSANSGYQHSDMVIDMAGFIYEGNFEDYWNQAVLLPFGEVDGLGIENQPNWIEYEYNTTSEQITSLFTNFPNIKDAGVELSITPNSGAQIRENSQAGEFLAQFILIPNQLPYLADIIEPYVSELSSTSTDLWEYISSYLNIDENHTLRTGLLSFNYEDTQIGSGVSPRDLSISLNIRSVFSPPTSWEFSPFEYESYNYSLRVTNQVEDFDGDGYEDDQDNDVYFLYTFSEEQVEFLTGAQQKGGKYIILDGSEDIRLEPMVQNIEGKYHRTENDDSLPCHINLNGFLSSISKSSEDGITQLYDELSESESLDILKPLPQSVEVGYFNGSGITMVNTLDDLQNQTAYALVTDPLNSEAFSLVPVFVVEKDGILRVAQNNAYFAETLFLDSYNLITPPVGSIAGDFTNFSVNYLAEEGTDLYHHAGGIYLVFEDGNHAFVAKAYHIERSSGVSYLMEANSINDSRSSEEVFLIADELSEYTELFLHKLAESAELSESGEANVSEIMGHHFYPHYNFNTEALSSFPMITNYMLEIIFWIFKKMKVEFQLLPILSLF